MIEWTPRESDEVVKVPLPPLRVTVPSALPLSESVTTPVAVGLTETETVTGWPTAAGFGEAVSVVAVGRLVDLLGDADRGARGDPGVAGVVGQQGMSARARVVGRERRHALADRGRPERRRAVLEGDRAGGGGASRRWR